MGRRPRYSPHAIAALGREDGILGLAAAVIDRAILDLLTPRTRWRRKHVEEWRTAYRFIYGEGLELWSQCFPEFDAQRVRDFYLPDVRERVKDHMNGDGIEGAVSRYIAFMWSQCPGEKKTKEGE